MGTMLRNSWTSVIGVLLGIAYYLQGTGAKMPETRAEWWSFGIGLMLAALGVVAKDATTGSRPGQTTAASAPLQNKGGAGIGGFQAPPKAIIALALIYGLGLSACATSSLTTSGTALVAVGKEFVAVAQVYDQGCHATPATIPAPQCQAFHDFGVRFKGTYPLAIGLWQAARDASDAAATKRAFDVISQLGAELGALALHGYDEFGGK